MATFNLNEKYSATYGYEKVQKGWECAGEIWKGNKPTGITFVGRGKTKSVAVGDAHRKAREVCPLR
jgi:hypothetical protein